jgi:hypothetical protein
MRTISKLIALAVLLSATSALAILAPNTTTYTFGTDNNSYDGFSTSTPIVPSDPVVDSDKDESWELTATSVRYINADPSGAPDDNLDGGTANAKLLQQMTVGKLPGYTVEFQGVVTLTDGYGDDNNRLGLMLFGDAPDSDNGLFLCLNTDDSGGKGGLEFFDGIGGNSFGTKQTTLSNYGNAWIGQTVTFNVAIDFQANGTMDIGFDLIDGAGVTNSAFATGVLGSDFTGSYFGFGTRSRSQGLTSSDRTGTWTMDYEQFTATVPEPATVGMFGVFGAALLFIRRRARRWKA